jgi:L-arabinokinase
MVLEAGPGKGVYGARVTGGGSGGVVCVLSWGKEAKQTVKDIYRQYKRKINKKLFFFSGSNHGALSLNYLKSKLTL